MAWIESHTVLLRHRKLVGLAKDLKVRKSHAMGYLHSLWHTALEQQEDGDLSRFNAPMIASYSDYPGNAVAFTRLLRKHEWLDRDLKIHDWWQYAGPYLRSKYKRNPEKWESIRNRYVTVTQPYTVPNRTVPNLPNHTNRTVPETDNGSVDLGEQFKTAVKDLSDKKARAAKEESLLALKWNVAGDHNGRRVQDLPGDYCEWALASLQKIGQEYKDALRVRLEQKQSEGLLSREAK